MDLKNLNKPKSKGILPKKTTTAGKPGKENMTASVFIPLRPSEKEKLEKLMTEIGFEKLAPFVRSLLRKHDYI